MLDSVPKMNTLMLTTDKAFTLCKQSSMLKLRQIMDNSDKNPQDELASLETPSTVIEPTNGPVNAPEGNGIATPSSSSQRTSSSGSNFKQWFRAHFNIYLLAFIALVALSAVGGGVLYFRSSTSQTNAPAQPLSQSDLDQLSSSDVSVGEPKHTLSVQSDTVFSGNVLVRDNLQIAGTLQVGSDLAIAGLRVTGSSTFDDVQITNSLAVTGNSSIQGQLNVQKSLQVNGGGTFLGAVSAPSVTAGSLQLNGDLNLTHHLTAGGNTPGRSNGPSIGGGGTASVSGSDTSGSVTINTGSGPSAGCYVTVNFATKFNSTPHVVISPANSSAAGLNYYVNRSTTNFSICATNVPSGGTTYTFDYIALD